MKFLNLNNAKLPALGYGTWQLEGDSGKRAILEALDIGYRHIDTAQMYNNEADVGAAIKDSGVARAELFITTKLWTTNLTPPLVASSFAESLEKLQMDYVDLLLIHWPNPAVPLGETLAAMQDLMRQKKTKAIGVSNFPVKLMREAIETHKAPIACNQVEYHVMLSQAAVLDYARKHNIIVTAYSPLGRGGLHKNQLLTEIGHHYGKTGSQVALRWLIEQDGVAAIPKAASAKNAQANFNIFDFELSDKDCQAITKLSGNNRLIDPDFAPKWDAA